MTSGFTEEVSCGIETQNVTVNDICCGFNSYSRK